MNEKEFAKVVSDMWVEAKNIIKDPKKRIYYLGRAERRAKNPEFKKLWKRKKEELIKNL